MFCGAMLVPCGVGHSECVGVSRGLGGGAAGGVVVGGVGGGCVIPGCAVVGDVDMVGGCVVLVCLLVGGYYWCVHYLRGVAGGVVAGGVSVGEDVWYVSLCAVVLCVGCAFPAGVVLYDVVWLGAWPSLVHVLGRKWLGVVGVGDDCVGVVIHVGGS